MSNLTDQILACFPEGEVIDPATLGVDANYDFVGRALRQLVEGRTLVRVGRGCDRKVAGRKGESAATITDLIERRISRSKRNVFLRSDFVKFGSYDAVGRALRQMTDCGQFVQIGYGLYAQAER